MVTRASFSGPFSPKTSSETWKRGRAKSLNDIADVKKEESHKYKEEKVDNNQDNDENKSQFGFGNDSKRQVDDGEYKDYLDKQEPQIHYDNGINPDNLEVFSKNPLEDFATQVLGHFADVNTAVQNLSPNQQRDFKLLWTGLATIKMVGGNSLGIKGLKANLTIVNQLIRNVPHIDSNRQLLVFLKEVRLVLNASIEIANDVSRGDSDSPTLKKLKEDLASIQPDCGESFLFKAAKFIGIHVGVGAGVVATSGVAGAGITAAVTGSSFVATLKFVGTALLTLAKTASLAIAGVAGIGASIFPPVLIAIVSLVVVVGIGYGIKHLYERYQDRQYQKAVEYFTSRDMASDVINYLQSDTSISNATKVAAIIMALDVSDLTPVEITKNPKYAFPDKFGHAGFNNAIGVLREIISPDNIEQIVNDLTIQINDNLQLKDNINLIVWWLIHTLNMSGDLFYISKYTPYNILQILEMRTNNDFDYVHKFAEDYIDIENQIKCIVPVIGNNDTPATTKVMAFFEKLDDLGLTPEKITNEHGNYSTSDIKRARVRFHATIDILSQIITPGNINKIMNDLTNQMKSNKQLEANKESIIWWLIHLNNKFQLNATENILLIRTNEEYLQGVSVALLLISTPIECNIKDAVVVGGHIEKDIGRIKGRFEPSYVKHLQSTFVNVSNNDNLSIIPTKDQVRLLFVSQVFEGNLWAAAYKFSRGLTNASGDFLNDVQYEDLQVEYDSTRGGYIVTRFMRFTRELNEMQTETGERLRRCADNCLAVEKFLVKVNEKEQNKFTIQMTSYDFFIPGSSEHKQVESNLQAIKAKQALMGTLSVSKNANGELNISQNEQPVYFRSSADGLSVTVTFQDDFTEDFDDGLSRLFGYTHQKTFLIDELFIYANQHKQTNPYDGVEETKEN